MPAALTATPERTLEPPYKYYAFVSYSRKDSDAAAWLQRRLEWFRFPMKLVPEDRRPPHTRYVRPIYRDKTNLEVTDEHYWTNLRRALEESRYLIVLCSENSAASGPVNMEVAHFLKTHDGDANLLAPVIVSGNVTSAGVDAALCPALRSLGDTLLTRNLPTMVPDATTTKLDAREQGFVSLVSYLLHLERSALGDHIQRETKRQARVLRRWLVAVGMLTVIAGVLAWLALAAKHDVEKANAVIVEKNEINLKNLHDASMADYAVAVQRIEQDGKWHEGVAHLARALKYEPGNALAAMRLYATLSFYAPDKQTWPRVILRHADAVRSAQFSPDGTRIVTASDDKTARVWDATTGKQLGEPLRHEGVVWSAQFSPDGTRIVTASADHTARIWDATTGKQLGELLRHEGVVRSAQFSPDGARIVTGCEDGNARVWDVMSCKQQGEPLPHEDSVFSAQFSPDGTRIVTASADHTARIWDATTGKQLGEPLRHEGSVESAQFSPDGARIITASDDKTARVWDATTGEPIGQPLKYEASVDYAQFSPDGTFIVTASWLRFKKGEARLWDASTHKPIGEVLQHEDAVYSAQFSSDGMRIVTASGDGTARVWDTASPKPLGEPLRTEGVLHEAEFNPLDTCIVTVNDDNTARIWDAATGKPMGAPLRHEGSVNEAHFSPDGSRIVTASDDKTARVWDAASGRLLLEPLRHDAPVTSARFSPDGTRIVASSGDESTRKGEAQLWDAATGKSLGKLPHDTNVQSAEFSPDGRYVVTVCSDKAARVWNASTCQPQGKPLRHEESINSAHFSPDSTRIVTASWDHTARVWNATTGMPLGEPLRHVDFILNALFSRDGTRVVTASGDRTARVWDATTGRPLTGPLRHDFIVIRAAFSPDGTCLVIHTDDMAVRLRDSITGYLLGEPLHHEGAVMDAQFDESSMRIVTAAKDGTARFWNVPKPAVPVGEWMLARAHAIAGLEFNAEGTLREIPAEQRRAVLLEPPPGNDKWAKLARWLAQPARERMLTPDSKFTCRQIAERERDSGFKEGLESALRYDPTVPLAHVLLAKFEENPQRADFLRGYGLKLLPNEVALWASAAASLVEQKDFKRARQAADKALSLDPKDEAAQKARTAAEAGR